MTVYILPGGSVYHLFLDHIRSASRGRALAVTLVDRPRCIPCEARRKAASA